MGGYFAGQDFGSPPIGGDGQHRPFPYPLPSVPSLTPLPMLPSLVPLPFLPSLPLFPCPPSRPPFLPALPFFFFIV